MIDDARLPVDIERGAVGGPGFRTTVISLVSGDEQRNQEWSISRSRWNVGYGIKNRDDMEAVLSFFYARRGKARGFRFRDWLDFSAVYSPVGSVSGDATRRQLIRYYADTVNPYTRKVVLPVVDTIKVYNGAVLVNPATYSVLAGGVIDFASDPGGSIVASFEYDIPARFDTDELDVKLNTYREGMVPTIPVIELRQ